MQTRLNIKGNMLRVWCLASLKPEPDDDENVAKKLKLVAVIAKSGKHNPILKILYDFVDTLL